MANEPITPRRPVSGAAVASLIPLGLSLIGSFSQPPVTSHITSAPAAITGITCGPQCGTERWPVKTLSDPAAAGVQLAPAERTVSELVNTIAPSDSSNTERLNAIERQAFTVKATLVGYKIEGGAKGDQDFHIVIQDPTSKETMIVEIPDPGCQGVCNSIQRDAIVGARADFLKAFPAHPPSSTFVVVNDPQPLVEVTGVGMYDFFHGQTGVAKNCLELHPVLSFRFPPPGIFQSGVDKTRMPPKTDESEHQCIPKVE